MPTLVVAEGALLARVIDAMPPASRDGLSAAAFATLEQAVQKTAWAKANRRRFALVDGDVVLATAVRGRLSARLHGQPVRIGAVGSLWADPARGAGHAAALIAGLIDAEREDGADLAMLAAASDGAWQPVVEGPRRTETGEAPGDPGARRANIGNIQPTSNAERRDASPVECSGPSTTGCWAIPAGFEPIPTTDVEVRVVESTRHGAPMTMVRGGEDRDLAAIVAMGDVRARLSRFHLVRDVDFVKFALTRRRLLAGLAPAGHRELRFLIAEEGITAAAYVVLTAAAGSWTVEECGDRDPSGARVGALLQAAIAREPVEQRPVIRGWLPPAFSPPQLTMVRSPASPAVVFARDLSARPAHLGLAADQVVYWRNDLF